MTSSWWATGTPALPALVVHVLFLRPDVAAVKVRQHHLAPDDESEGATLYVMTKQDDSRWLLAACQNTGVVAD